MRYSQRVKKISWKTLAKATFFATLCSPVVIVALIQASYIWLWIPFLGTPPIYVVLLLGTGASGFGFGTLLASRKRTLHGLVAASLTPVTALLSVFVVAYTLFPPPPSDWRLIRQFERNEALFKELRDAVQGGGLEAISLERVEPPYPEAFGISPEQLTDYRTKIKRLGLRSVTEQRSASSVTFSVKNTRSLIVKDYLYLERFPRAGTTVEKIRADDVEAFGAVYRPIRDGWYLYAREISD